MKRGSARRTRGRARDGVGAIELLVALILFGAAVHGAWRVFAGQRRAAEELRARTEILDADRAVRVILAAELGAGLAGRDWTVAAPGIVPLRAFRGWAAACPDPGPVGGLLVAYRGLRLPDPEKDSVLVLGGNGRWVAAELTGRAPWDEGGCPGAEGLPANGAALERWSLDPFPVGAVLLRVFERGSYHLEDGGLRYSRGAGGRQPVTAAVLDAELSGIRAGEGGVAVLTVGGAAGRGGTWTRTLPGNVGWSP